MSMPFRTLSRISQERSGAEQNFLVRNLVSPYRMCPASFSFSGLDGAEILETIESEKDLGLVVSSNFKWDEQIKSSIAKANKTIAWVSRNIICKDQGVPAPE